MKISSEESGDESMEWNEFVRRSVWKDITICIAIPNANFEIFTISVVKSDDLT